MHVASWEEEETQFTQQKLANGRMRRDVNAGSGHLFVHHSIRLHKLWNFDNATNSVFSLLMSRINLNAFGICTDQTVLTPRDEPRVCDCKWIDWGVELPLDTIAEKIQIILLNDLMKCFYPAVVDVEPGSPTSVKVEMSRYFSTIQRLQNVLQQNEHQQLNVFYSNTSIIHKILLILKYWK